MSVNGVVKGGFYFHPKDEDLSLGSKVEEKATWGECPGIHLLWFRCRRERRRTRQSAIGEEEFGAPAQDHAKGQ